MWSCRSQRRHTWDEHRDFAEAMARVMAEEEPDRYVANMSKAKRRGKIFVDYLRNQRGATAICPFSTRARPGAYVAMPVSWETLGRLEERRIRSRSARRRNSWAASIPGRVFQAETKAAAEKIEPGDHALTVARLLRHDRTKQRT